MKNVRENEVESYLVRRIEDLDGMCVKIDTVIGFPDRLVLLPNGSHLFVETKRPHGGTVSGAQLVQHMLLRRMGHRVEVVWDKAGVDALVESVREK